MSFFMKLNVTELRDGITSLHGIHDFMNLRRQENRSRPLGCPLAAVKPRTAPCCSGEHVVVWVISLTPPAGSCPMTVSNGTSPPVQVNVWVKLFPTSKTGGYCNAAVNLAGTLESIVHGKESVKIAISSWNMGTILHNNFCISPCFALCHPNHATRK